MEHEQNLPGACAQRQLCQREGRGRDLCAGGHVPWHGVTVCHQGDKTG